MIDNVDQTVENENQPIEDEKQDEQIEEIKPKTRKSKTKVVIPEHVKPESDTEPKTPKIATKRKIAVKATPINSVEEKQPENTIEETPEKPQPKNTLQQFFESLPKVDVQDKPVSKKGHRPKKVDKEDVREKTVCPDCGKTVSIHSLKYTHKRYCKKKAQPEEPKEEQNEELEEKTKPEPTLKEKMTRKSNEIKVVKNSEMLKPKTTYREHRISKVKQLVAQGLPP